MFLKWICFRKSSAKRLPSFNLAKASIVSFLFWFSQRITGWLFLLDLTPRYFFNRLRLILYSKSVIVYFPIFTRWQIRATKLPRPSFICCTYKIVAFFADCSSQYFNTYNQNRWQNPCIWAAVLSRSMCPIEWKPLKFCSKSTLSMISLILVSYSQSKKRWIRLFFCRLARHVFACLAQAW